MTELIYFATISCSFDPDGLTQPVQYCHFVRLLYFFESKLNLESKASLENKPYTSKVSTSREVQTFIYSLNPNLDQIYWIIWSTTMLIKGTPRGLVNGCASTRYNNLLNVIGLHSFSKYSFSPSLHRSANQ